MSDDLMNEKQAEMQQYLTFRLHDEHYAVTVGKVREVLVMTEITAVPQSREYMRGVINLRGSVVPVLDLRTRFALPETEDTVDTCIIVVEILKEEEQVQVGLIADSVQEVINLDEEQIEEPPKIGSSIDSSFIQSIGKYNDRFLIILDLQKVFEEETLKEVQKAAS
jgi:purine-binding chemotaxis protein CheW